MTETVTRGSVTRIRTTPKDADGADITPTGDTVVSIYFRYPTLSGYKSTEAQVMSQATLSPLVYEYVWDTSGLAIEAGTVYGSIRVTEPSAGEDFEFDLAANPANPAYVAP